MVLPRMVLALQELVLRLASQSSSHEETNINTLKGEGVAVGGRSSVKNNNNEKSGFDLRRRPLPALSGDVSAL